MATDSGAVPILRGEDTAISTRNNIGRARGGVWTPLTAGSRGPVLHHLAMMVGVTALGAVIGTLGIVSLPAGLAVGGFWFAMTLQAVGGLWFGAWGVAAGTLIGFFSNAFGHELPVYVLGLIPANFIQSFLTAWVFRRWRLDPSLPTLRELLVFIGVGPLLSNFLGAGLAVAALAEAGHLTGPNQAERVVLGWVVGNGLPCLLFGVPLLKTFSSQVVDSPFFCRTWWGGGLPMRWEGRRFRDLPVAARLLIDFFLAGVAPMMVVALIGTVVIERKAEPTHPEIPLMLNVSIFLSLIVSGMAARRMRGRVGGLMEGVRRLSEGDLGYRVPDMGGDEMGEVGRAFNAMAEALARSRDDLRRTTEARARDIKELEIASEIQQSFLPKEFPVVPGLAFAARTTPARMVGGDFYDFIPMAGGRWGILIADVSGKGVPAALLTGLSRALIRSRSVDHGSPADVLRAVNDFMAADNPTAMYVTCFFAVLDGGSGRLAYANAGHNPPLLLEGRDAPIEPLPATGTPLGLLAGAAYAERELKIGPGHTILLYTDGVTEAFGPGGDLFGQERLEALALEKSALPPQELLEAVEADVSRFSAGLPQSDDVTVVVVRWT